MFGVRSSFAKEHARHTPLLARRKRDELTLVLDQVACFVGRDDEITDDLHNPVSWREYIDDLLKGYSVVAVQAGLNIAAKFLQSNLREISKSLQFSQVQLILLHFDRAVE